MNHRDEFQIRVDELDEKLLNGEITEGEYADAFDAVVQEWTVWDDQQNAGDNS